MSVKAVVGWRGSVLLVHNERGEWELPGGRLEAGESPEAAVARELREEVDLVVNVQLLLDLGVYEPIPGRQVLIAAYGCVGDEPAELWHSHEHDAVGLHRLEDLDSLRLPVVYRRSIDRWSAQIASDSS